MPQEMAYYERNLPHWHPEGRAIFVTWRLYGSLPRAVAMRLRLGKRGEAGRRFKEMDEELDRAAFGPRWLGDERIARALVEEFESGQTPRNHYLLHAFVIMLNHVHVLLSPKVNLGLITKQWKGATARYANRLLGRVGQPFWQEESFDHWIRNPTEFERIRAYIERNPVGAGLAARPEDWPWSSASPQWRRLIRPDAG